MGFQRIMAALDRSPLATEVYSRALQLAVKHNSELMLAHCFNSRLLAEFSPMLDTSFGLSGRNRLRQLQQDHLQDVAQIHKDFQGYCYHAFDQGVSTRYICEMGDAAVWICQFARRWRADLVVIGHGGSSDMREVLLGSVSRYVVRYAPCPTMVVQPETVCR
ncbi:universal stress protein [Oculatella sp. LEGE 06141]|uniref:universal stress protein n=1 Tax=Oculatella sp. LEGE 06141 TaxID=1828648 RepID=UPI00187FD675|nr:universal stress protein [Oculatella sp. LEGE 06141]MBE9182721.1 universal stress protein [Oculatella sp. LEGE 06141]